MLAEGFQNLLQSSQRLGGLSQDRFGRLVEGLSESVTDLLACSGDEVAAFGGECECEAVASGGSAVDQTIASETDDDDGGGGSADAELVREVSDGNSGSAFKNCDGAILGRSDAEGRIHAVNFADEKARVGHNEISSSKRAGVGGN